MRRAHGFALTANPNADSAGYFYGQLNSVIVPAMSRNFTTGLWASMSVIDNSTTGVINQTYGSQTAITNRAAGTISNAIAYSATIDNRIGGTIGSAYGALFILANQGAGTITNYQGVLVESPTNTGGGTITSVGGLVVDNLTVGTNRTYLLLGTSRAPSGNFGIYNSSPFSNYFAGNVGIGTNSPVDRLHVNGVVRVDGLGTAGSTQLCRNASNQIATCSSSLRYKTQIAPFSAGLEIINRLRPISFTWRDHPERDLGLGAEDVAAIEPLLVTRNAQGQIEGVKYDRVSIVLVNAIKQQEQIKQQQTEIDSLKKLVCQDHPGAEVCKNDR